MLLIATMLITSVGLFAGSAFITFKTKQLQEQSQFVGSPQVIVRTLDPHLDRYAEAWKTEIARRFPNAFVVFVHGNETADGIWACQTMNGMVPVADIVLYWQSKYPKRTIVLLSCNPGHLTLGVPGVYYFRNSVWLVPDRACQPDDIVRIGKRRMTIHEYAAPILPSTTPSTKPSPLFPFIPRDIPFSFPFLDHAPIMDSGTRWGDDPEVNGNIYEAVTDDQP